VPDLPVATDHGAHGHHTLDATLARGLGIKRLGIIERLCRTDGMYCNLRVVRKSMDG
jgi:hypothetical protein